MHGGGGRGRAETETGVGGGVLGVPTYVNSFLGLLSSSLLHRHVSRLYLTTNEAERGRR